MVLSVVIVSYKSADLLMLTLASVRRAIADIDAEVFVVDNASQDGTVERVRYETPWVQLIEMPENVGFSRANNEAMRQCHGRVVLILNPDTVVCRDTLRQIVAHFDSHPDSGAIGVRMVNGEGAYLRESKRGYTTLLTSFFKLSGLWRLAPHSRTLNAYYIGHRAETDVCHAPVLSGACVAFSRQLMERVGYFDDSYFMYSEDIDLSWRMNNASAGNTYRGDISIVHFKGQSTPRSRRYIGYFYDSMLLFARKHEYRNHNALVNFITKLGIKTAYLLSLTRCLVMRHVEQSRVFVTPQHLCLVSDNQQLTATSRTTYAEMAIPANADAILFDIDGDLPKAIDYMRAHAGTNRFGFYNPDCEQSLLFFSNRCYRVQL